MLSVEIEKLRIASRIGKFEFAKQIDMSRQGYDNALKNDNFRINTLKKIAEILGVDITHFFKHTDGNNTTKKNYKIQGNNNVSDVNDTQITYKQLNENENLRTLLEAKEREITLLKEMKDAFKQTSEDLRKQNEILFNENQDLKQKLNKN